MILAQLIYEKNVSGLSTDAVHLHLYRKRQTGNLYVRFQLKISVVFIVFSISVSNFMENAGMKKQPKAIIRKTGILPTVIKTKQEEEGLLWFIKLRETKHDIKKHYMLYDARKK